MPTIMSFGFNSRTPGGVRLASDVLPFMRDVSIHAPQEGCDSHLLLGASMGDRFNSRTPGGVRRSRIV